MNDQAAQSYWDGYGKATKEESGGGGGIISLARVETGFKVFASGVGQDESWFPASAIDKAARSTAKKAASKLADEYGCRYAWGIAICTPREKSYVRGEKATWNVPEMVRFTPSYSDACNEIVIPSLKGHKLVADGSEKWLRLGFQDDPYAVENDKKDDQERFQQVAYVTEVFKNPRLAKRAIAEMPKGDSSTIPEGYDEDDWEKTKVDIAAELDGYHDLDEDGQAELIASVAADYELDTGYIQAVADDIVPM